jgi:protein involved in sex pheromone biosynthesis
MNRYFVLAAIAAMVAGCASDFGDDTDPTTDSDETEESQEASIRTFGGAMQRPTETLIPWHQSPTEVRAAQYRNYYETVEQADLELGAKYARSSN